MPDDALWSRVWRRMATSHGFISPALVQRSVGPDSRMTVTSTWQSSPWPVSEPYLAQNLGTYQAWYKAADAWALDDAESSPGSSKPDDRARPALDAVDPYSAW